VKAFALVNAGLIVPDLLKRREFGKDHKVTIPIVALDFPISAGQFLHGPVYIFLKRSETLDVIEEQRLAIATVLLIETLGQYTQRLDGRTLEMQIAPGIISPKV
jgi:hypothetical protein